MIKLPEWLLQIKRSDVVIYDSVNKRNICYEDFCKYIKILTDYINAKVNSTIIVMENNSVELCLLYFAVMFTSAVIIPIDPEKEHEEIEKIISIHSEAFFFDVGDLSQVLNNYNIDFNSENLNWETVDFNRVFLITYTSGSTGNPKGVMHSLSNLFNSAYEFGQMMHYDSKTIMGHCMPMTYMAGILNTILMPFLMGGTIAILPRFSMINALKLWDNVVDSCVNTIWLSPTMIRILMLLDKKGKMKEYFKSVSFKISVGTAPLDKNLRNEFELKYDTRLYQSYGLSETLFISTEVMEETISIHTVGRVLPSVNLELSNDGEILIDAPWNLLGYCNDVTDTYFCGKKYKSGDLGEYRGENLIITGRKKELILKGGYNINPRDIENAISTSGMAMESAIISVNIKGEELIAGYVILKDNFSVSDINSYVVNTLGKHYRIDYLIVVNSIPKNLNGKIDKITIKSEIEELYDSKG